MTTSEDKIAWFISAQNSQEANERYDAWAAGYDKNMTHDLAYFVPARGVEEFTKVVAKNARILDSGAETGLVARYY